MSELHPVQEDELHGFVDGRLTPQRHAEIAALLERDPALAQRLADWQAQRALLCVALAGRAREPVPPALHLGRLIDARLSRRAISWRLAAGFVLCLGLGGVGGWVVRDRQQPDDLAWLVRQAESAHRVFASDATDAAGPDGTRQGGRVGLAGFLSRRLGYHVAVPDLTRLGYRFLSGRLLAGVGGPAALLLYADAAGDRVSVYVQPMRNAPPSPMHAVQTAGASPRPVGGYVWIKDRIGYSVLAAAASPGLHHLANVVRDGMAESG